LLFFCLDQKISEMPCAGVLHDLFKLCSHQTFLFHQYKGQVNTSIEEMVLSWLHADICLLDTRLLPKRSILRRRVLQPSHSGVLIRESTPYWAIHDSKSLSSYSSVYLYERIQRLRHVTGDHHEAIAGFEHASQEWAWLIYFLSSSQPFLLYHAFNI
jgi:hypothetical protein